MMILLSVLFHSIATVLLKIGAMHMSTISIFALLTNYYYFGSIFFLFLQAITWQKALNKYALNVAYLFTTLYYPITMINGILIFGETPVWNNYLGILLIIAGLLINVRSISNKL